MVWEREAPYRGADYTVGAKARAWGGCLGMFNRLLLWAAMAEMGRYELLWAEMDGPHPIDGER